MSFSNKLTRISALQIFQLIRFSTLLLIGVVFAKSGFTTSEIGLYETFLFLASAISFFWLNGLIQGFLPASNEHTENRKSSAFFNVFFLISVFSVLSVVFLFVFENFISAHLVKGTGIPFFNYLVVYLLISSPAGMVEYVYLVLGRGRMMLIYSGVSNLLMLVLVAAPAVLGLNLEFSMIGLVASAAFRIVWLLVLISKNSVWTVDLSFIRNHLKLAWPLIVSMLLSGSGQYIDGFLITTYFDEATFAVFRFGAREFPLVLLLANAFSASMLPGFSDKQNLNVNLEIIRGQSKQLASWLFPLSGVMMLVSHWAFPIVFNAAFAASATIFNIYLLLIISRLLFPQTILIGMQKTNTIMWVSFFEIVVNVLSSLILMQFWGIIGVAIGTVIAYLFEKILLIVFVRRKLGIPLSAYLAVRQHVVFSVFLSAEFLLIELFLFA